MYTNVVTTRQRVPHLNPPEATAIVTHPGPGFWADAPSLQGLVRSEEVSRSRHLKRLAVPTLNTEPLKPKGDFPRRAHREVLVVERDDGLFEIVLGDDGVAGPFETRNFAQSVASNRYSGDDPPPKRRRAALAGSPNRKSRKPPELTDKNEYASRIAFSRAALCKDRALLAGWYAVTADSLVLGSYPTRLEAARASGVCP
jgi:hypothetical protein